jgi:hypothetical protein
VRLSEANIKNSEKGRYLSKIQLKLQIPKTYVTDVETYKNNVLLVKATSGISK